MCRGWIGARLPGGFGAEDTGFRIWYRAAERGPEICRPTAIGAGHGRPKLVWPLPCVELGGMAVEEIEFRASSQRLADETHVVSVAGELDLHAALEFEQALPLNGGANQRVVIDLSECTFIDSTGLGILVKADRHIGGNALLIVAAGSEVLRAFEVSGLARRFALHPTLESALNGGAVNGWHDKEARHQALFREVNEQIEQVAESFGSDGLNQLICECGNPNCTQQIKLTGDEYERVRAHASRFVVALNHENPETESIVEQNDRFAVVETYAGESSRIARETDPRSQHQLRTSRPPAFAETRPRARMTVYDAKENA